MTDWKKIRALFPALKKNTYLNSAGGAPISEITYKEAVSFYDQMLSIGDIPWTQWLNQVEDIRNKLASYFNASPHETAFIQNTSHGMNIIAQMLKGRGDVLALEDDFPTSTIPFRKQGFNINYLPSEKSCNIDPDKIDSLITPKTAIVVASTVMYSTGFRLDMKKIGEICRNKDVILVSDASQSIFAFETDVNEENIDFLVFSANKWGMSGYGIGGLFIDSKHIDYNKFPIASWMSVREPELMDNRSENYINEASMLETGGPSFPNIFALGGTLKLITSIGIDNISSRIIKLTDYLHEILRQNDIKIVSDTDLSNRSGTTIIDVGDTKEISKELFKNNVITSARNRGLRVSLNFYNNKQDIDRFISVLCDLIK